MLACHSKLENCLKSESEFSPTPFSELPRACLFSITKAILHMIDFFTHSWPAMRSPKGEISPAPFSELRRACFFSFTEPSLQLIVILPYSWPAMRSPKGEAWWRRRESNPRPKTFHIGIYILILKFRFRRLSLLQAGYLAG